MEIKIKNSSVVKYFTLSIWIFIVSNHLQFDLICRSSIHRFIRKVLALPFLPVEQITETFNTLKDTVDTEKITKLMDYINNTWINGSTWKPASWTVYGQSVRTNNDVEGWHHRINRNQTCRCTFSSYYCTVQRKPDYYRLNSRWSQRENFDVTKERKRGSCSTGFSPYWRSAARFTATSNDLTQGRFDNSLTLYLLCYFVYL